MIRQTLSCVSRPEYLFSFTSFPIGDGGFGRVCLAVGIGCYDEQNIDLTAHIWTSAMAVLDWLLVTGIARTARL